MAKERELLLHRKHAPAHLGRVLILGLGKSGKAAYRYCSELLGGRVDSIAVAAGMSQEDALSFAKAQAAAHVTFFFDTTTIEGSYDLCIASPGISQFSDFYLNAQAASAELISEVEFAWRESCEDALWIAVTGTNGKTTTTALTAHVLKESGYDAVAVGNIGDTCLEAVSRGAEIYVAEVSSYQLASTKNFAPNIAILLNITPDHLSWHKSHEAYVAAKLKVFSNLHQNKHALAILDATDGETRQIVKRFKALSREERGFDCVPLGAAAGLDANMCEVCGSDHGAYLCESNLLLDFAGVRYRFGSIEDLQIKGGHNAANALAAAVCASACGASEANIAQALRSFKPLEHRIEPCGTVRGVACFNDSKATNVDATLKAFAAFSEKQPIVLLGGEDKGTLLDELVESAERYCKAVVCFGEAGPRFLEAFKGASVPYYGADKLEGALDLALEKAEEGDVLILSPACASFDEFKSFEHRGRVFKELVALRASERGA